MINKIVIKGQIYLCVESFCNTAEHLHKRREKIEHKKNMKLFLLFTVFGLLFISSTCEGNIFSYFFTFLSSIYSNMVKLVKRKWYIDGIVRIVVRVTF